MFVEVFLVILFVYLCCKYFSQRPKNFPPGPKNYPLVGGIFSLPENHIHFTQQKWLKEYGPVVGVMMANKPAIFIQGHPHVEEALKKPEFQGRPHSIDFTERSFGKQLGIFFNEGHSWMETRKFTVRNIKNFGTNKMEEIMNREMDELADRINNGEVYDMTEIFKESTANILWTMLSGSRCTISDKRVKNLLELITESFRNGRPGGKIDAFIRFVPILRGLSKNHKVQQISNNSQQQFIRESIQEHRNSLDPENPRDFFDVYLTEEIKRKNSGIVEDNLFSEENLIVISMDVLNASYESLNSTMAFTALYFLLNPQVQTKLHEELDTVLGSRRPTLKDRLNLPYTEAVIAEVYRINTIAPIVAPHRCLEDTIFNGFFVPKDTMINFSLWSIFYDENLWDNPEEFKPERFLNEKNEFIKNSVLVNFGVGRRMCAGDFIAHNVVFLYISRFFQRYSITIDPNNSKLDTTALPGFTTSPKRFKAVITERY